MVIDENTARNTAAEDAREDMDKNADSQHPPECWRTWLALHESESDEIAKTHEGKLHDRKTQLQLIESEMKESHHQLQNIEESEKEIEHKLAVKIKIMEDKLAASEDTTDKTGSNVNMSSGTYKKLMMLFGVLEIPLNWVAFQALDIPNLITVAAVTIVVGILLVSGAHFVGQTIKQFPLPGRSNHLRIKAMLWIMFWIGLISGLYFFITTYREVGLTSDQSSLFWFMMIINAMLFALASNISYKAHYPDVEDDQQIKHAENEKCKLQKDLEELEEELSDAKENADKKMKKLSATLEKNKQQKIAVAGEYKKHFNLIYREQEEIDNQLQLAIESYRDEYAKQYRGSLPPWMLGESKLHVSFIEVEDVEGLSL